MVVFHTVKILIFIAISNFISNISAREMLKLMSLKITYEDINCIKYRRIVYMTWDNILSSIGGIFGLCLGGSFISILEIVYYLIIRIVGTITLRYSKRNEASNLTPEVFIISNEMGHSKDISNSPSHKLSKNGRNPTCIKKIFN